MKSVQFPEQNHIFGANQKEYQPLHAFCNKSEKGEVVACWKLSLKERLRALVTGRVWVMFLTFNKPLQPSLLSVEKERFFIKDPPHPTGYHFTTRQFVWLTIILVSAGILALIIWLATLIA